MPKTAFLDKAAAKQVKVQSKQEKKLPKYLQDTVNPKEVSS